MVERVAEDHVAGACECLDGPDVGCVAGGEEGSGREAHEVRVRDFGIPVGIHCAGDEARRRGPNAFIPGGGAGRTDEGWVIGEAEVIVGAEAEDGAAVDLNLRPLGA